MSDLPDYLLRDKFVFFFCVHLYLKYWRSFEDANGNELHFQFFLYFLILVLIIFKDA